MPGTITLDPARVAALVRREFTRLRRGEGGADAEQRAVGGVPSQLPGADPELLWAEAGRDSGVRLLRGAGKGSAIDFSDVRLVLWLREAEGHFFNEFAVTVGKFTPAYLRVTCHGVTAGDPEQAETLAFLQH